MKNIILLGATGSIGTQTISGENSLMISKALVILLPKLNAAKRYSLLFFIKSKVCVPIEQCYN